jgi:hypothetical protein
MFSGNFVACEYNSRLEWDRQNWPANAFVETRWALFGERRAHCFENSCVLHLHSGFGGVEWVAGQADPESRERAVDKLVAQTTPGYGAGRRGVKGRQGV